MPRRVPRSANNSRPEAKLTQTGVFRGAQQTFHSPNKSTDEGHLLLPSPMHLSLYIKYTLSIKHFPPFTPPRRAALHPARKSELGRQSSLRRPKNLIKFRIAFASDFGSIWRRLGPQLGVIFDKISSQNCLRFVLTSKTLVFTKCCVFQ